MIPQVRVQAEDFDLACELEGFGTGANTGATVSFTGRVRDDTGDLQHLEIEHYPAMCEAAIEAIAQEAVTRWALTDCRVIHRFGAIPVGDQIMMVATAARHRKAAFEAAEFLMDYLKSRAPFWKKEVTKSGTSWVEAKDEDEAALRRW
ncbi:molybdenum cofactor biosynthesis protein MoaE [Celeribacter sp.]|uniref:molybdenum cofactor biosynthesis protein MoaE n=1 Tax=Celeribacter sp. TaxID=1890673 RepID=UPI003A9260A3